MFNRITENITGPLLERETAIKALVDGKYSIRIKDIEFVEPIARHNHVVIHVHDVVYPGDPYRVYIKSAGAFLGEHSFVITTADVHDVNLTDPNIKVGYMVR